MGTLASGSIDLKSLKVAGEGATDYITDINSNGIFISPVNVNPTTSVQGNSVKIDGTGMEIYKNSSKIAEFKSYINLGINNTNIVDDNHLDGTATIGTGLVANKAGQMVLGNYNTANSNALFIIGNGTSLNSTKNAFTVESIYNTVQKEVFDGGDSTYTLSHNSDSNKDNASAYDLYGTRLTATGNDTTVSITSGTITLGDSIEINYSYLDSNNESITTQEFYTAATNNQTSFTVANTISSLTSVYNKSIPVSLTINSISGANVTLSSSSTSGHQIQINYTCAEDDSYVKISNSDSVLGAYSLAQGDAIATGDAAHVFGIYNSTGTIIASGTGSSAQGFIYSSGTMSASNYGSSAQGYVDSGTMAASGYGSSAQGDVGSGIITASGHGSSAQGHVSSGTMKASGVGSFAQGRVGSGTMTTSGVGSSAQGYIGSGTMSASGYGSSTQGYVDRGTIVASAAGSFARGYVDIGTITASNYGSFVQGDVTNSGTMRAISRGSFAQGRVEGGTMKASGTGSFVRGYVYSGLMITSSWGSSAQGYVGSGTMSASSYGSSAQGYVDSGTITASGYGSSAQGYVSSGTMRASSYGSFVQGYVDSSTGTMIASNCGSIALNEGTHAVARAQLAIGTYNSDDPKTTTTHPSGSNSYGTYVLIIGNGTTENARSNALTVDWNGGVELKNGLTQIYNSEYNSLNNTYYKTDGYHAFYATDTAGVASTGSFYVYGDHLMSTVPLNMKVNGTDYPVQGFTEGSSGDWYYRKWSGGKVEAWYRGNVSCSATAAAGNVYRSTYSLAIPNVIFSSAPIINVAIDQNASTLMSVQGYASSKTAISGYVFRSGSSSDTYNTRVAVYAWTN